MFLVVMIRIVLRRSVNADKNCNVDDISELLSSLIPIIVIKNSNLL